LLRIEHLRIGERAPLTFEVADGECLAVEGPSGAGKTRLLRAIADLDPAPGQVFLDGAERNEMPSTDWRRQVRFCQAEPLVDRDPRGAFPEGRRSASTDFCIRSGSTRSFSTGPLRFSRPRAPAPRTRAA
jgi:ABC-type branched-subunit amino acid transport system ATPase component